MNKKVKPIIYASIALNAAALVLSIIGSVFMFLDRKKRYDHFHGYPIDEANPEAGILPAIGVLTIIVALVMIILALNSKKKLAITTIVFSYLSQIFLYASTSFLTNDFQLAVYGYYYCCIPAGVLMFVVSILAIVSLTKTMKIESEKQSTASPKQTNERAVAVADEQSTVDVEAWTDEPSDDEIEMVFEKPIVRKAEPIASKSINNYANSARINAEPAVYKQNEANVAPPTRRTENNYTDSVTNDYYKAPEIMPIIPSDDVFEVLLKLKELHDIDAITDGEYASIKRKIVKMI